MLNNMDWLIAKFGAALVAAQAALEQGKAEMDKEEATIEELRLVISDRDAEIQQLYQQIELLLRPANNKEE